MKDFMLQTSYSFCCLSSVPPLWFHLGSIFKSQSAKAMFCCIDSQSVLLTFLVPSFPNISFLMKFVGKLFYFVPRFLQTVQFLWNSVWTSCYLEAVPFLPSCCQWYQHETYVVGTTLAPFIVESWNVIYVIDL